MTYTHKSYYALIVYVIDLNVIFLHRMQMLFKGSQSIAVYGFRDAAGSLHALCYELVIVQ